MNTEAQRIAIAEACGWTIPNHCRTKRILAGESPRKVSGAPPDFGQDPGGNWQSNLPDYLNSLDAMHEAEKVLTPAQQDRYILILGPIANFGGVPMSWSLLHATAAQRAEAFLRTIGKWSENPA